jgi:Ion channel.
LTTVGYGDIVPKTAMEQIIAVSWMMVGVGFYSFTIGNLSSILETLDRRSQALKNKLTAFNNFAMKVKLPVFLRQKVQRYFEYSYS